MKNSIILLFLAVASLTSFGANVITLTGTAGYTVGSNDVAEVIAVGDPVEGGTARFSLNGNGIATTRQVANGGTSLINLLPMVIAGPSNTIARGGSTFVTFRVRSKDEYLASFSAPTSISSTAVVIPEDASGPVSIILESSTDLVTWTPANPGTYGSSTMRRFFRVRAVQN